MRETRPTLSCDAPDRAAWHASFDQDVINLRRLPTRTLVGKARAILESIGMGVPYTRFRGKRFHWDRTLISVPLGLHYRLLFRERRATCVPSAVSATKPTTSGGQGRGVGNPTEEDRLVACLCW